MSAGCGAPGGEMRQQSGIGQGSGIALPDAIFISGQGTRTGCMAAQRPAGSPMSAVNSSRVLRTVMIVTRHAAHLFPAGRKWLIPLTFRAGPESGSGTAVERDRDGARGGVEAVG